MEVVEFGRLSDDQRRALEGDEPDPFDTAGVELSFRPKDRHVALADDTGGLVASTGMVLADVEVNGDRFPVVGFGGVIVSSPHRGLGLGRAVVQAAIAKARTLGPSFVILFCHEDRAGLYRKLGFVEVRDAVIVRQPAGLARMTQRAMWLALQPGAVWPEGRVFLDSLPF